MYKGASPNYFTVSVTAGGGGGGGGGGVWAVALSLVKIYDIVPC